MSKIDYIKKPIAEELDIFNTQFKQTLKSDVFLLNQIIQYVLKTKGKQVRPMLTLLSAKIFGNITPNTYTAASLVELLHTVSLVHDDVVDDANERRNAFSVYALWKSKTAVLLGDYLLARGLIISVDNQSFELLRIVSVAVQEMSEGELLQLQRSRKQNITREDYFEIIRKKTASLLSASTEAGAQSAGASPSEVERMKQFGIYLGLIFQIKDDIFDYQPQSITGKPIGNDIKEKKLTLPLIYALENVSAKEKRNALSLINGSLSDREKLKRISALVYEKKGIEHCCEVMEELRQKAIGIIDSIASNDAATALKELVDYTINRRK